MFPFLGQEKRGPATERPPEEGRFAALQRLLESKRKVLLPTFGLPAESVSVEGAR